MKKLRIVALTTITLMLTGIAHADEDVRILDKQLVVSHRVERRPAEHHKSLLGGRCTQLRP